MRPDTRSRTGAGDGPRHPEGLQVSRARCVAGAGPGGPGVWPSSGRPSLRVQRAAGRGGRGAHPLQQHHRCLRRTAGGCRRAGGAAWACRWRRWIRTICASCRARTRPCAEPSFARSCRPGRRCRCGVSRRSPMSATSPAVDDAVGGVQRAAGPVPGSSRPIRMPTKDAVAIEIDTGGVGRGLRQYRGHRHRARPSDGLRLSVVQTVCEARRVGGCDDEDVD